MQPVRKNSRKRQALLDALCATHEHPTAEMLYNQLKGDYPELSLGTVYRNLGVLVQEGLVQSVGHINGQERYDAVTGSHPHFVCKSCHKVIDLELPDTVSSMFDEIDKGVHCAPEGYSLTINGLCEDCRAR